MSWVGGVSAGCPGGSVAGWAARGRARTVKGWLPRRLGGGLGGTRKGADHENSRNSGRDDTRGRGGDRGSERKRSRSRERRRRSGSRDRGRGRDDRSSRRSRSRDRKRSKRSRSRSKDRRKRDRKEEGGIKVKDEPLEYKAEPEEGTNFDMEGVNVKQEAEANGGEGGAAEAPRVDRNMPMSAPGEEVEY